MKLTVGVEIDNAVISAILDELTTPDTMLEIHNTLARMCDPYVPFLNGPLSQSGLGGVTSEGVAYTTPYARYQYYGENFNHTVDVHPLASAMWDQAMLRDHGDEFNEQVRRILRDKAREIYHG